MLQTFTADSERSSAEEASASSLDVRSVPRHRLKKQTSLLHAGPTDKHTRPALQNEAYDNCVFVVLGLTPFVTMGPKTRPRRKLLVAFRRHAFLHQKPTPKSGPQNFEFSAPEPCDFVPVWGTLGAQCSAKFPGQVVTSTLAANSTRYLQMGQARDCFSIILAASWI